MSLTISSQHLPQVFIFAVVPSPTSSSGSTLLITSSYLAMMSTLSSTVSLSALFSSSSFSSMSGTSYVIALTSLTPSPIPSPPVLSTVFYGTSSSLSLVSASPTLLPKSCMAELTESSVGQIQWPVTAAESNASVACPFGPSDSYASRQCVSSWKEKEEEVMWGVVDDSSCLSASQILQGLTVVCFNYIYNKYVRCKHYFSSILIA